MIINYWDCEFNDYEEFVTEDDEYRVYGCTHPDNEDRHCNKENKWCNDAAECPMAELQKP